jgi:hypothetical protein
MSGKTTKVLVSRLTLEKGGRQGGYYWQICYNNALRQFRSKKKAIKYANEAIKVQNLWGGTI